MVTVVEHNPRLWVVADGGGRPVALCASLAQAVAAAADYVAYVRWGRPAPRMA